MRIYDLNSKLFVNRDLIDAPNLTDRLDAEDLSCIGDAVFRGYEADEASRSKWKERMSTAMDLAMQVSRDKSFPWPGCSNVIFPLITIAALQFSSRSYSNIIQGTEIAKYRVTGEDPNGTLERRASRISKHMSWQVLEEDIAWEEVHDKLLINLGIVGCNFVKTYFNAELGYITSDLVMARDLVIDYYAKSVDEARRKTHIIQKSRNEIYEAVYNKTWRDILEEPWFGQPATNTLTSVQAKHNSRVGVIPPPPDEDTPFTFIEQHRYLDLDKDGYQEPYIVTQELNSKAVVRVVARIEREEDVDRVSYKGVDRVRKIKPEEYFTKYGFIPSPDGGIYDVGFGTLLGPINEAVDSGINQLLDAGTMANANGGFLGRGAKIRGGVYTFAPWEWKRVDSTGDDLRKSLVQLPTREPSQVMFNLIGLLIQYCDRMAGTVDTMVGENPGQNTKTGVANQTLEQGMQVYSSIFKRIWRSMKMEFGKRHQLNRQYLPMRSAFGEDGHFILQEDYNSNPEHIRPYADPRLVSDQQRMTQAQAMCERAQVIPGYNIPEVEKNFLHAMRVEPVDKFYPGVDKVPPLPNPRAEVEQVKAQARAQELEHEKWMFVQELQLERIQVQAEVEKLRAEAAHLTASIGADKAQAQADIIMKQIDVQLAKIKLITERIKAVTAKRKASEQANKGGSGRLEKSSSDSGSDEGSEK